MVFFFQAEDGIRYLVRSRGLGDVYKRQPLPATAHPVAGTALSRDGGPCEIRGCSSTDASGPCLLYTSDAADERYSVDLGGRRIIKKKNNHVTTAR